MTIATIKGNGSSLWGPSKDSYEITEMDYEVDGQLRLYGPKTDWVQYTDSLIAKTVNKIFKPLLEKQFGVKIKTIGWSEQGMQPDGGWDFDVILKG